MQLRDWNAKQTAHRFILHPNTVRSWIKAIEGESGNTTLFAGMPWSRIDDMIRWAVRELQRLFPEQEFCTRAIARHLVRAGIQISRTTVQRIMREQPKPRTRKRLPMNEAAGVAPYNLLEPSKLNDV